MTLPLATIRAFADELGHIKVAQTGLELDELEKQALTGGLIRAGMQAARGRLPMGSVVQHAAKAKAAPAAAAAAAAPAAAGKKLLPPMSQALGRSVPAPLFGAAG